MSTPHQLTFDMGGLNERLTLPEKPPEPTAFAKLQAAHPWCLEWIRDYLRREVFNGATSVSVRAAMEACRHHCSKRLGDDVPGVGRVGLNNNCQREITQWLYRMAPDVQPYVRRRER